MPRRDILELSREADEIQARSTQVTKKGEKSRIINPLVNEVPTPDELEHLFHAGEITAEEFEEFINYFYPSVWVENHIINPTDPETKIHLWRHQVRVLDHPNYQIAMRFGRQIGKCLEEDAIIHMGDGTIKRTKDVYEEYKDEPYFNITSYNQETCKLEPTKATIEPNAIDDIIIEVESKSGNISRTNEEHPYLVWKDNWEKPKWVHADDVEVGDRVATVKSMEDVYIPVSGVLPSYTAELYGLLLGDGTLANPDGVRFTSETCELPNRIQELLDIPGYNNLIKKNKTKYEYSIVRKERPEYAERRGGRPGGKGLDRDIIRNLKECGLAGTTSHTKFVPDFIMRSGKTALAAFIGGMWATDGYVTIDKNDTISIGIGLCNEFLIKQIQTILWRLGINSRRRYKKVHFSGKDFDSWVLSILDRNNIIKFHELVKIPLQHKQRTLDMITELAEEKNTNSNHNTIPKGIWRRVKRLQRKLDLSNKELIGESTYGNGRLRTKYSPNPHKLLEQTKSLNDKFINNICNSDVYWDEVIRAEEIGRFPTYVVTVPKHQTLVNDGFITHNTAVLAMKAIHTVVHNENRTIVFYAPQQRHIDNCFDEVDKYLQLCNEIIDLSNRKQITDDDLGRHRVAIVGSTKRPMERVFSNGCRIKGVILKTTDDGNMGLNARGIAATDVFFDEAAFIPSGAFSAALLTTRSFVRPTIWVSSTPTLFGLNYKKMCQSEKFQEFHVSADEADNWTDELETFYRTSLSAEEYDLDIRAEWGDSKEGVFKKRYIDAIENHSTISFGGAMPRRYTYADVPAMISSNMFQYFVIGVDWNKPEYGTRVVVLGATSSLNLYLLESIRVSSDHDQLYAIQEVIKLDQKYGGGCFIYVDEGYGDYPTHQLHLIGRRTRNGLDERVISIPTAKSMDTVDIFTGDKRSDPVNVLVVKNSVLYLERGWVRLPTEERRLENATEISERKLSGTIPLENVMETYVVDRYTPTGRPIYRSNIGDDHSLSALMYAAFGVNQYIRPVQIVDDVIGYNGETMPVGIVQSPVTSPVRHQRDQSNTSFDVVHGISREQREQQQKEVTQQQNSRNIMRTRAPRRRPNRNGGRTLWQR